MQPLLVALVYGSCLALAVALLYFFHARWYWHALSLAASLGVGLTPLPAEWKIPDLLVGAVFVFLFVWGLGLPLFRLREAREHTPHHA
ncbi:MAG: hypothetical protein ACM336_04415 [Acidobacteriota bacterium]